jgi:hypothetical protein
MKLLHESEENQILGWNVNKNIKFPIRYLFINKLRHKLSSSLKEQKLKGVNFRQRSRTKGEVHFYELEKGLFLGENDDGDDEVRPIESLMNYQEI